jgi:hypothetical protein
MLAAPGSRSLSYAIHSSAERLEQQPLSAPPGRVPVGSAVLGDLVLVPSSSLDGVDLCIVPVRAFERYPCTVGRVGGVAVLRRIVGDVDLTAAAVGPDRVDLRIVPVGSRKSYPIATG